MAEVETAQEVEQVVGEQVAAEGAEAETGRGGMGARRDSDTSTVVGSDAEEVAIEAGMELERSEAELNEFWKEHDAWKQAVLAEALTVDVGEPQQGTRTLLHPSPPVTFQLYSRPLERTVRRRYSDFAWLRQVLLQRYVGILVPSLPGKRVVGNASESFVKQRMRGLGRFMDRLLGNAYFCRDATVRAFLARGTDWEDYKASTDARKPGSRLDRSKEPNEGRDRWNQALQAYRVPGNEAVAVAKVHEDLCALEGVLKGLTASSERVVASADGYVSAMAGFAANFQTRDGSSAKHAAALARASEPLRAAMGSFGDTCAQWASVGSCFPAILDKHLHSALKEELFDVEELKRLLAVRESLRTKIARGRGELRKLEDEKASHDQGGRVDRSLAVSKKMAFLHFDVKAAEQQYEWVTKGLFFTELDLFVATRCASYRAMAERLAKAHLEYMAVLGDVWRTALGASDTQTA